MSRFQKATKKQLKGRVALYGPSGSGKTYSALRIAGGLGGSIAVIDSERGSASKYSDRFDFSVLELIDTSIREYIQAINDAAAEGFKILIIDSLSHAWQNLLGEVEKIASARYSNNKWSAWSEGTPMQNKLIDAILAYPGHVIVTMRSKTEWTTSTNDRGKTKPERVGAAPIQGKGIEYEFDLLIDLNVAHVATVQKDRTGQFQDQIIEKPDEAFGQALAKWLDDGEVDESFERKALAHKVSTAKDLALGRGCSSDDVEATLKPIAGKKLGDLKVKDLSKVLAALEALEAPVAVSPARAAAADSKLSDDALAPL